MSNHQYPITVERTHDKTQILNNVWEPHICLRGSYFWNFEFEFLDRHSIRS